MLKSGEIVKTEHGHKLRIESMVGIGGQGTAYLVTDKSSGREGILKLFHPSFHTDETYRRIRALIDLNLRSVCPVLVPPVEAIRTPDCLGHFAPLATGEKGLDFLGTPTGTFISCLHLGVSYARALHALHSNCITYGDVSAENILVQANAGILHLSIIDFDNYNFPGVPASPMLGQKLYLAPELVPGITPLSAPTPTEYSERFSLAVLLHELILWYHPAAGSDGSEAEFARAMYRGQWVHDPAGPNKVTRVGGHPPMVLNTELLRLFRLAMSLEPEKRPSAGEWDMQLTKAFENLDACVWCHEVSVIDASKSACPYCHQNYPVHELVTLHRTRLRLDRGALTIGRDLFAGAAKVSANHAVIHKVGPIVSLTSLGQNGTYRWAHSNWIRLPDRHPVILAAGDRLRFADQEAYIALAC